MTVSSIISNPAAYHILSYGTILGSAIFQSFVAGVVSYKALPRPQFSVLQQNLMPIYFGIQTFFPIILGLTFPATTTTSTLLSKPVTSNLLSPENRSAATAIFTMLLTGAANLLFVGPATTKTMRERKHQETRDGKKYYDQGPKSENMQRLNRRFSIIHGVSSSVNLVGIVAVFWYGFILGERLV